MASLSFKIKAYAESLGVSDIDWRTDVLLQNDSDERGEYINEWNLSIAQPTDEQLTAQETAATIAESNVKNAETNAETKKASGKAKLKALGLDDEEIKNLMGA
tara:strand:- start:39 stop:347 length:309 start_codon:yes stop_codon:yes gene_type:complete